MHENGDCERVWRGITSDLLSPVAVKSSLLLGQHFLRMGSGIEVTDADKKVGNFRKFKVSVCCECVTPRAPDPLCCCCSKDTEALAKLKASGPQCRSLP